MDSRIEIAGGELFKGNFQFHCMDSPRGAGSSGEGGAHLSIPLYGFVTNEVTIRVRKITFFQFHCMDSRIIRYKYKPVEVTFNSIVWIRPF